MPTYLVRKLIYICWLLVAYFIGGVGATDAQEAQPTWAPIQQIPFYDDAAAPPSVIVDGGVVHAFNSVWTGSNLVITYTSWKVAEGWTSPVDIVLPPIKQQARLGGVYLDQHGVFHMVFFSGDDLDANIYYTQAPIADVRQSSAWLEPMVIGSEAVTPSLSAITGINGELIVVFSGSAQGRGLYSTRSKDLGATWSTPEPFFLTYSESLSPSRLTHMTDTNGRVHLAWTLANAEGNGDAIYYTNYDPVLGELKRPFQLAEAFGFEADTALLFEYEGELFIIYHNDVPTTRWMRRSRDGGETWTEPVKVHPTHVGSNGPPTAIVDSANRLHLFFGSRTGSDVHGMWHITWDDAAWSTPMPIVAGPRIQDDDGGRGFDPSQATAALVQGRYVLLMWRTDPGAGLNGVWFTHTDLGTPAVRPTASPGATPLAPTPTITPEAQAGTATSVPELATVGSNDANGSALENYIVGVIPALVLVAVVFIVTIVRSRRFP